MIENILLFVVMTTMCLALFVSAKIISLVKLDLFVYSARESNGREVNYATFKTSSKLKLYCELLKRAYILPELYLYDTEEVREKLRLLAAKSLASETVIVYRRGDDSSVD